MTQTIYPAGVQTIPAGSLPSTAFVDVDLGGAVKARAAVAAIRSVANAPTPAGATITVTGAEAGGTILLNNAAGSVATLPAATGSGSTYTFAVTTTTTSNKHAILAASSADSLTGVVTGEHSGTTAAFSSAIATGNHSLQMPFTGSQPSGGIQGDYFQFTDIATGQWLVRGAFQAGTTPTTPFSTATS